MARAARGARRGSRGCRSSSSPATTTAPSRRSSTTRRGAAPLPEAVAAIRALAALPQTTVAVISGRALRDLATLSRLPERGAPRRQPRLRVRRRLRPAARARAASSCTAGCARSWREIAARAPGRPPGDEAGQRRRARPRRRPGGRRAARSRPSAAARRRGPTSTSRSGKDVDRAVGARDRQGRRGRRAPHPGVGQRRALPRRRRHRRERVRAAARPRRRHQDRRRARRWPRYRVDEPIDAVRVLGAPARDAPALALRRARGADRAALDARRTARRSRCSRPTPRSPGSATRGPTPRRSSPTCSAARGPGTSRSPRRATGIPLGQRYRPGTMTVETRWPGLTVTDWLEGGVPNGGDGGATSRLLDPRARADGHRRRAARVRAAARVRPGADQARSRSTTACSCSARSEPIALYAPGVEWDVFDDGGHDTARAVVDLAAAGGTRGGRAALRLATSLRPAPGADRRAPGAGRAAVARLGGERCGCPRTAPSEVAAQRADAARALPRADGLDPRRGDDVAARGARRRPQLGLPLLLAARRRDVGARARRPRLARGGRGVPALGRRLRRSHRRAPGAAAPALHGRRARARARRP